MDYSHGHALASNDCNKSIYLILGSVRYHGQQCTKQRYDEPFMKKMECASTCMYDVDETQIRFRFVQTF